MAILGFTIRHLTERGQGKAAQEIGRYLYRQGEYAPQEVGYALRTSEDTVARGDYVTHTPGNLPAWAKGDAVAFFREAERRERGGSQRAGRWATTWQLALPKELTRDEQWAMGAAFVAAHLQHHAYLCVMHDPVKDGEHQPHLHVLFSERTDHGKDVDAETYFRRPEVGGCAKDRWFHQRNSAYALRESWADWCNYTLEAHHHAARVHPRSLYARDIDRKPEPKVGYSSDPALHARRVEIQQARDVAQEQALAAAGWEARKRQLGTTHLAPEAFLACSVARARQMQPGRAYGPMLTRKERQQFARDQEYERLTGALAQVERQLQDIQDARQGQPVPVGRVMAALAAAEADDVARGLRAHIFAKEDSYGR